MYAKSAWKKYDCEQLAKVMEFNEDYKEYLSLSKTERESVKEAVKLASKKGRAPS